MPWAAIRSGENEVVVSPLPRWRCTGMPASWAAAQRRSQWGSPRWGRPKRHGSPVNSSPRWPVGRAPLDLGHRGVEVPERGGHHRDEPVGVGRGPVAQEVVVGPHADELQLVVAEAEEPLAAEAGHVGVEHLGPDADLVHVGEPGRRRRRPRGGSRRRSSASPGTARASPPWRWHRSCRTARPRGPSCPCRRRCARRGAPGRGASPRTRAVHTSGGSVRCASASMISSVMAWSPRSRLCPESPTPLAQFVSARARRTEPEGVVRAS